MIPNLDYAANVVYTGIVTREGNKILIAFPDCPGCQTFVEDDGIENIVATYNTGREALIGWLEAHLDCGQVPPAPKTHGAPPGQGIWFQVPSPLAERLLEIWTKS